MHVDRFGARKAREIAIEAVKKGAGECLVKAVYAPNVAEPLDVQAEMSGGDGDARVRNEKLVLGETTAVMQCRPPRARAPLDWR